MKGVPRFMPRRLQDLVVFAAPAVFVVLWATGFIGAKFGLPYAEPLTFLALRMGTVVVLLGAILSLTRPKWPGARGVAHSAVTGLLVHGLGLGGVFVAIWNGLSAGMVALVLSLQPALTSTIASRWLGERVRLLQWVGLALGLFGIYLIVRDKATTAAPRRSHGRRARLGFSASRSARFIKSASVARSTGARRFACNMRRRDFCLCSGRPSSKPAS